jgi:hypothetical protein
MPVPTITVDLADLAPGMVYKAPEGRARWIEIHDLGPLTPFYGDTVRDVTASYRNGKGAGKRFTVRLYARAVIVNETSIPAVAPTAPVVKPVESGRKGIVADQRRLDDSRIAVDIVTDDGDMITVVVVDVDLPKVGRPRVGDDLADDPDLRAEVAAALTAQPVDELVAGLRHVLTQGDGLDTIMTRGWIIEEIERRRPDLASYVDDAYAYALYVGALADVEILVDRSTLLLHLFENAPTPGVDEARDS